MTDILDGKVAKPGIWEDVYNVDHRECYSFLDISWLKTREKVIRQLFLNMIFTQPAIDIAINLIKVTYWVYFSIQEMVVRIVLAVLVIFQTFSCVF